MKNCDEQTKLSEKIRNVRDGYLAGRKERTKEIVACLKARGFKKASKYIKWLYPEDKHD